MLRHLLHVRVYHVPEQDQVGQVVEKKGGSKVVCIYILSTHHYCLL